jgi:hypothetical protein
VPDCTAFTQTLPFFICQETYSQCIDAHPNDAQGQQTCTDNMQCGTRNATAEAIAQTSAAAASSASSTSTSASSSTAASTGGSASSSSAAATGASASPTGAAVALSQQVATGACAAVLMAAFKLLI